MGRDPITGEALGEAYRQYASMQERVDKRVADLDLELGPVSRADQVEAIEAEEAERGTRRAVAGYDLTFSVPKSLSALWGVADAGTQSLIADAHHQAVAQVVAFLEREVATTRVGTAGSEGAVAFADVAGVLATAFDHYDSRSGDPQLHTHVVVSNKVLTVQDQRWRTLAGRPAHASVVALSELYNATLADRITGTFGIEWEARERGRDRNPAWELAPVPEELVAEFSSRTRQIEQEKTRRGLKWGVPAMLLTAPYLLAIKILTVFIAQAGPGWGWLHLVVLLCAYNTWKMFCLGPISLIHLARARLHEHAEHRKAARAAQVEHEPVPVMAGTPS